MNFSTARTLFRSVAEHRSRVGGAVLIVLVAVLLGGLFFGADEVRPVSPVAPDTYTLTTATSVPLMIEGVLTPKDDAVLAAQTSGRLASVGAREGASVVQGEVLAVVGQPVGAAERDALVARIRAVEAQRVLAESSSGAAQQTATVSSEAGRASGDAAVAVAEAAYDSAREALFASLERNYLTATEALKFLSDTSSLATRESVALRVSAAETLSGTLRSPYLGANVLSGGTADNFADALSRARVPGSAPAPAVVEELTQQLLEGLTLLNRAFDAAERSAYERTSGTTETERGQYNTYRIAVRGAQSSVEQSRAAFTTAARGLEEARIASRAQVEVADAALAQAVTLTEGERAVSAATLADLRAQLRALDVSLGQAVVRAPYAGVVTDVYVDPGAYVSPGTPVARIQSAHGYELRTVIPARYAAGLQVGSRVTFAQGGVGVLDRITPQVDAHAGGITAFIVLDSNGAQYTAGARIRGELSLVSDESAAVFEVPHRYVSFDFAGPVVHVAGRAIPVEIVRDTATSVYVRSPLLDAGMLIERS